MRFPLPIKWLSIAAGVTLAVTGCSDTTLGTRSFNETIPTFQVPGSSLGQIAVNDLTIPVEELSLATQEAYENDEFEFISSVTVRSLTLEIDPTSETYPGDDGNPDNFDFVSNLEVYLQTTINGVDRSDLVASLPDGDPQYGTGTRTLNLTVTDVDVLDYIELGSGYKLVVKVSGYSPPDFVVVGGKMNFRVGIGFR